MSREAIFEASLAFFLSPIQAFLEDPTVTEVMVNGCDAIYVERQGRLHRTEAHFDSEDSLLTAVHNVAQYVGREIDEDRPVLDARLPDGSRVHAVIPPSARQGTYLTIRKFSREVFDLDHLVRLGSVSAAAREFLEICVRLHKNLVVAGGTGTGKTSLLNALSTAIPPEERIVVIEDSSELRLQQPHTLYLESQQADSRGRGGLSIRDLFRASLRMRPDRIVVGEVRGGEALDMIQAMNTGHEGSMTTVHANTPRDAIARIETLVAMGGIELPLKAMRHQFASAVDMIIQVNRLQGGPRKITSVTEVLNMEQETIIMQEIFRYKQLGIDQNGRAFGQFEATGVRPAVMPRLEAAGIRLPPNLFAERILLRD